MCSSATHQQNRQVIQYLTLAGSLYVPPQTLCAALTDVCMQGWIDDKTLPSGALAKCKICNDYLTLLLELNGDLPEQFPGHERRIYIWSCRRKTCRRKEGSVRGIRGVRIAKGAGKKSNAKAGKKREEKKQDAEAPPQPKIGESLFGVTKSSVAAPANPFVNPFSTAPNGKGPTNPFSSPAAANPFAAPTYPTPTVKVTPDEVQTEASTTLPETFADKVRLSSPTPSAQPPRPHEPWPQQSAFPPAYPPYALDAEYETLDAPSTPQIPENARGMDVDMEGGNGSGKEDKDVYESTIDKTFQRFADRIGENAEQVLRYEFKGKPLLYSDSDTVGKLLMPHSEHGSSSNAKITTTGSRSGVGFPPCQNCGADRVFEVQLTPHLITELEADEMSIDGMEWGTIVMGVCDRDCKPRDVAEGEVGYVEEWVGVQWEEVNSKR
jgi:pre-rRNA-processing protein TSR4